MAYNPFWDTLPDFGSPSFSSANYEADYRRRRAMAEASGAARPGGLLPQPNPSTLPAPQQFAQRVGGAITNAIPQLVSMAGNQTPPQTLSAADWTAMNNPPQQPVAPLFPAQENLITQRQQQQQAADAAQYASQYNGLNGAVPPGMPQNRPNYGSPPPVLPTPPTPPMPPLPGLGGPMAMPSMFQGAVSAPFTPPPAAPLPGLGGPDQNPLFTRPAAPLYQELDKIQADSQARARETDRLRAAGAAQNTDMILGDAAAANRNLGAVIAGRSPGGVFINPQDPVMTAQQARGMGLNYSYGGALPPGYEMVGSNLRRVAPPTQTLAGTDTPEAQAILNRQMPRVALPPMPKMETRKYGQKDDETAAQFAQRRADISAARASRSPASGAPTKFGDTYADQKNFREGREAELAMVQAKAGPARTESAKDQSIAAVNLARIEQMKNAPEYARRSMVDKARLDAIQAKLDALAKAAAAPLLEADERRGYLNEMNKLATEIDKFATSPDPSLVTTDGPGAPPLPQGGATPTPAAGGVALEPAPKDPAQRKVGKPYKGADGKTYKWDGKGFIEVKA